MLMRPFALVLLCLAFVACVGAPSGQAQGTRAMQPVAQVDLSRYAGRWYEIARYPNRFERNCQAVTADYALRADGRVSVVNTCRVGATDGRERVARGTAAVIEGSGNARLAVNFAPIPLPRGQGNYWVLYLDAGYQTALVGEPSRQYLWLLARTPRISEQARARLEQAAVAQGYDLSRLENVPQP
jgi:apolipoprotein D and lipocalin family protein